MTQGVLRPLPALSNSRVRSRATAAAAWAAASSQQQQPAAANRSCCARGCGCCNRSCVPAAAAAAAAELRANRWRVSVLAPAATCRTAAGTALPASSSCQQTLWRGARACRSCGSACSTLVPRDSESLQPKQRDPAVRHTGLEPQTSRPQAGLLLTRVSLALGRVGLLLCGRAPQPEPATHAVTPPRRPPTLALPLP